MTWETSSEEERSCWGISHTAIRPSSISEMNAGAVMTNRATGQKIGHVFADEQWSTDAETCVNAFLESTRQFRHRHCQDLRRLQEVT